MATGPTTGRRVEASGTTGRGANTGKPGSPGPCGPIMDTR